MKSVISMLALVAGACTTLGAEPPAPTTAPAVTVTTIPATTTTTGRACPGGNLPFSEVGSDPVLTSIAISRATYRCADVVLLAPVADGVALGAALAHGGGPLLLVDGIISLETLAEIDRLAPLEILAAGLEPAALGPLQGVEELPPGEPGEPRTPGADIPRLWIVPAEQPGPAAAAQAAALEAPGSAVLITDSSDLRAIEDRRTVQAAGEVIAVGFEGDDWRWQLDAVLSGHEIPGGGLLMFPGRRLVAFYGNPTTRFLGVLGEQGPAETAERIAEVGAPYAADGLTVLPTFEIIATVASSRAGADNDYSQEMDIPTLQPWVDFAAENGVYVVLDLQPGRTDFLTQAKRYEELLRLPHVGLALDPEWRLKPNQVHLQQIGSVTAEEVNAVSEWLAALTRDNALPQKLLLLHQFKFTMLPDREDIVGRPELALVLQMDGQGPLATKYETWRALTAGAEDVPWMWGWKSFYDEDSPMATPAQVLDLEPQVVLISFQ